MREIKFRAWHDPITSKGAGYMEYEVWFLNAGINEQLRYPSDNKMGLNIKIMQFTGLLDRHGKEIFEGDIVSYPNRDCKGPVRFGVYNFGDYDTYQRGCGFYIVSKEAAACGAFGDKCVEVIGNVYQSPELLESI